MILFEENNDEIKEEPGALVTVDTHNLHIEGGLGRAITCSTGTAALSIQPPPYSQTIDDSTDAQPAHVRYGTFDDNSRQRRPLRRRVVRAVLISWGIWAITFCLIQASVVLFNVVSRHLNSSPPGRGGMDGSPPPRHKKPSSGGDGRITTPQCVNVVQMSSNHTTLRGVIVHDEDRPLSAVVDFSIPTAVESLSFFSDGFEREVFGYINFVESEHDSPEILVDVTVSYSETAERVVEELRICMVETIPNEKGIGVSILLPPGIGHADHIHFDVSVQFPTSSDGPPLFIKDLKTDFFMFHHRFSDFSGKVQFGSVDLKTSSMPMYFLGLTTNHARVVSSNGLISGIFNITSGLELITENAPISAVITLNDNDATHEVKTVLRTSNSPIDARLSFRTPSNRGGKFSVDASTLNHHIEFYTAEQPIDSSVSLAARTSGAPAMILIDPAFEGSFKLSTDVKSLVTPRSMDDPEGFGRQRRYRVSRSTNGTSEGRVWWGDTPGGNCTVEISTSMFPITLQ